jgi:hypothetical protein
MDLRPIIENMFPCWILGLAMMYLVKNSEHSDLLKVNLKGLLRFGKFLILLTVIRVLLIQFVASDQFLNGIKQTTEMIPWQLMFGVWWEDACNAMALVVISRLLEGRKWLSKLGTPLIAAMALSFGLMHLYEGIGAVAMMTAYVPITMMLGRKYGFGTVMICHMAYDLLTVFTFKLMLGL